MNPLLLRFHSILTELERARLERLAFQRLLKDRPAGARIRNRTRNPAFDLKRAYGRRVLGGAGVSALVLGILFEGMPEMNVGAAKQKPEQLLVQIEDIPETRQVQRPPPPPRPAEPIETTDESVPDEVTIESTDLGFDDLVVDVPPPPSVRQEAPEEETLELWVVEEKPQIVKQVPPSYPELARRAGIEGSILVRILIGKDGLVKEAHVLRGEKVFHNAALDAVRQYRFTPAVQNDRPVQVWMAIPVRFRLVS